MVIDTELEDAYDIRVVQARYSASLVKEAFLRLAYQLHTQHFDGRPGLECDMLAQINFSKAAMPQ
jgi:hypothetical protein